MVVSSVVLSRSAVCAAAVCAPARHAAATASAHRRPLRGLRRGRGVSAGYNLPMPEVSSALAFIDAIKAGEFDRVKAMVSEDPALIDARGRTGESAILTAVYHRQKEIVNLLVSRGAAMSIFEACVAGEVERAE